MYETMMTRHTTMIVGPTGGGKSVVINTLCQAQTKYVPFVLVLTQWEKSPKIQSERVRFCLFGIRNTMS